MSISLYFALAVLAVAPGAFAADLSPGELHSLHQRIAACTSCHGLHGQGFRDDYIPRIGGQPSGYLFRQLKAFQNGRRANQTMEYMVRFLPDDYLHEIANYFSAQRPRAATPAVKHVGPKLLQQGRQLVGHGDSSEHVRACADCHGDAFGGALPDIPGIAGQPDAYIKAQLGAWRSGTRHGVGDKCMRQFAHRLKPRQIAAIAAFLSHKPYALPADIREPNPRTDCSGEQ